MRLFLAFVFAGFRRYSVYRAATAAGAITNSVFGVVRASILLAAIASAGGVLTGFDARQAATFAFASQALMTPVMLFGWTDLADRIRTGDIAVDLSRPADLQLSWLASDLGRAAYQLLPRGLPPLAVGALFFGLTMPTSALPYVLAALSVPLAVALSFACRFLTSLAAFWLLDLRGVLTLYMVVANVFSGLIIPVPWFPDWLRTIAGLTPFPSVLQVPVDVLSGRVTGWSAVTAVCVQALWLVGVLALGRVVLSRATRRLVVQGG